MHDHHASIPAHYREIIKISFLPDQLGAGELYGLSEFVLGYEDNGGALWSLFAASEVVKVI